MSTGVPDPLTPVPTSLRELAGARPTAAVWCNDPDGFTDGVGTGAERAFLKFPPGVSGIGLSAQFDRLRCPA